MKKRFLIFSLVAILVLSVCVFTACGDNDNSDNSSDTPSTPTVNDYILRTNVDYSNMEFTALSDDEVLTAFENSALNPIDAKSHLLFTFNATANVYQNEDATVQSESEEQNVAMTFSTSYDDTGYHNMIFNGKIGDNSLRVEFDGAGLRISYTVGNKTGKYNINVEQFTADYYLNVYGLTSEQTAKMKQDYDKSKEKSDGDSSTITLDPTEYAKSIIGSLISCDAIKVSTTQKDQLKYIKIEANGRNLYTFITQIFNGILASLAEELQPFLYGINQLDFYATINAGYLVDARADIDIDAPATIMYLPFSSLTKTFWQGTLHPAWLGDTQPVSEDCEFLQADYLVPSLIMQTLPVDPDDISNQRLTLKGSATFRFIRTAQRSALSEKSCKDLTWDGFISLLSASVQ